MSKPLLPPDCRLGALRRFAGAITLLNILGHAFFGFETSYAHPLVALLAAYSTELVLELVDCRARDRPSKIRSAGALVDFLLPAHITALAVAMLLYPGPRFAPTVLACVAAIGSKYCVRLSFPNGSRHVLNPSNAGIAFVLLLFPSVGICAPYQFTENTGLAGDLLLPMAIILSGTFLNTRFTGRLPTALGWLAGFALQALVRALLSGISPTITLAPATGMAFLLFTFYMVTDPATTPEKTTRQLLFGASTGLIYGLLTAAGAVFGMFFAAACAIRGGVLYLLKQASEGPDRNGASQAPNLAESKQETRTAEAVLG